MARTAFFMDDRLGAQRTLATIGPNGERPASPLSNALNDRPRVVWQTPADGYFSIDRNQYIDLDEGGGEVDVQLPHCVGTGPAVAQQLASAINSDAGTRHPYTVLYNPTIARFQITASSDFSILWGTGSHADGATVRPWLGFDKVDLSGSASYTAPEARYGTDHWAVFDLGSAKGFTLGACILEGGDDVAWNTAASVVKLYGSASNLGPTDRSVWEASAAKTLTFSNRPDEDQNKIQIAFDTAGAAMSYRYWAFSWRYFDADPLHAVGLRKALVKYGSSSRQVTQLRSHGLVDSTPALGVRSYYPSQRLQVWRAPLNFDNWEASDYRSVVTKVVRAGRATGLAWSLRWSAVADGTYDADDEADKGVLLWAALQDYSEDDYGGAASDFISGEITLEQVR